MLSTDFVSGAPNWLDLGTPDIDRTAAFYGGVFGWTLLSAGPDAGGYGFLQHDGKTVAGIGPLDAGQTSAWTTYFNTTDADATTKAVEQAGGTIRLEPFDVFTHGRMAQFTDPGGAEFAVWQPGDTKGFDQVTAPGTLTWLELHTPDPKAAQEFYGSTLSWNASEMPMSDGMYTLFTPEGGDEGTMFAGASQLPEGHSPHWLPYFEVSDVDETVAKATSAGAAVVLPATEAEGVGRWAWLTDPFGARFGVMKSEPAQ